VTAQGVPSGTPPCPCWSTDDGRSRPGQRADAAGESGVHGDWRIVGVQGSQRKSASASNARNRVSPTISSTGLTPTVTSSFSWVFMPMPAMEATRNQRDTSLPAACSGLGTKPVPRLGHVDWKVRYEPGYIEARATKGGKPMLTERRETTGDAVTVRLTADRTTIDADGEDVVAIKVEALDQQGRAVPTASALMGFTITGQGRLIGVGNGDPNCQESDKAPKRSLFNGLAQVLVQATRQSGEITVTASKSGGDGPAMKPATLTITTRRVPLRAAAS